MADQYDGAVRINTGLDTSGFESGSDKLMDAILRIEAAINRLGDTATSVLETLTKTKINAPELPTEDQMRVPSPEMDTHDLDESTRRVQDDMARTREALRQPDNPDGPRMDTTDLDQSTQRVQDDMRGAQEALDTELPVPAVAEMPDSAEFDREAGRMQSAIDRITREIDRMVNTSAQGFRTTSAVLAFSDRLDDAGEHIAAAREELRAFAEQQIPTDQYVQTTREIERAESALLRLYDRRDMMEDMGVSESSAQWERLSLQIQAAEEQVERYENAAEQMRSNGVAFVDPKATDDYRQMVDQLQEAEAAYQTNVDLIQQEQIEQARANVLTEQEGVAAAATAEERRAAMQSLQEAQAQLQATAQESVMPGPGEENLAAWERVSDALMEAGRNSIEFIRTWGGRALHGATVALRGLVTGLKGVATAAAKAVAGIRKIDSTLKGFFTNTHKGKNTIDTLVSKLFGIKRMLMSRLKRTFISYLFNQITNAVKEMAKFDARFDQSISNLRNRTTELSANIVSGFTGLFRQIEPYITRLLEAASNGVIRLNAILASLRGETSIAVARRQTQSYAASLQETAQSAEEARQAQLRLNRALTSYDELHKLGGEDTVEYPEADAAAQQQEPLYENIPVEAIFTGLDEAVQDAIDRLIAAVRSGDWYGAGAAVADGLNYIVASIDDGINSIHDGAVRWAHNIAEALNGLVDNFDARALGRTIADAVNLAVDVAYEFLTTFNFGRLGERIGDAITGFLTNLDAEQLGRTIAAALNDAVSFAYGLITHTNFGLLGQRVGEAVNGFFGEFDVEALGRLIAEKINAVFDFAYGLLTTIDFSDLGQRFAAGLNALTEGIDVRDIGRTLVAAINGILDFAYEAITGYDWAQLGKKLGDLVNELFGGGYRVSNRTTREVGGAAREAYVDAMEQTGRGINWARVGQIISEGIVSVLDGITAFLETVDWYALGQDIIELLKNIDWAAIAQAMIDMLRGALGGLAGLIQGALGTDEVTGDDITYVMGGVNVEQGEEGGQSLISTHVFDGLAQKMTDQYRHEFEQAGEDIGDGIMVGFEAAFEQAERKVKATFFDPLVAGIKKAFDIASPSKKMKPYGGYIAEGLLAGIKDAFAPGTIKPWVEANVRNPLLEAFNSAFSVSGGEAQAVNVCGRMIADGIKAGIASGWAFINSLLSSYAAAIRSIFPLSDFIQTGVDIITGIGKGLSDSNSLTANITNRAKNIATLVRNQLTGFVNAGLGVLADIGLGLGDGNSLSAITTKATAIADRIKGAITGFIEKGQNIVSQIGQGLSQSTDADGPAASVAQRIRDAFTGFVERGQNIVAQIGQGLSDQSMQTNNVETPATSLAQRIKGAFSGFVEKGKAIISDIGSGLTDQTNWDQKVGTPATTRAEWLRGAFTGFVQKGKDIISQLGTGLTDQGTWNQNVGGPALTRAGWIRGAFDGFVQKGKDIISQLGGGISDLGTWNNTVGGTVLERVSWIVNGLRSGNYYDAGRYIVQGLDRGIQDQYSESRRIAESLGGVVLDAFNRAMGIGSPSKVMAEAGGFVVAGLVQGIDGESKRAYAAMRTVADGIIRETDSMEIAPEMTISVKGLEEAQQTMHNVAASIINEVSDVEIEPEVNVATRGLDAVADKLAAIADIFSSIRDTLRDFPSLPVPAVAMGTVAPAQTRVTTATSGSDLAEMRSMLAQFLTRVTELEEATTGRPIRLESTIRIDEREIGRAVEDYNRNNNNITNGGGWR